MMRLAEALSMIPGARLVGDGGVRFERVHSDTRTLASGDLFVAIRGERFDAHDFLAEARAKGCAAAIAERGLEAAGLAGLEVADTRRALAQLAAAWRRRFEIPLIAVTGSNGKTTVTQMIGSILAAWLGEDGRLVTQGNLNNDIGLPLTLLRLRAAHRAAAVEIGMNHRGEIGELAPLAAPTVALVNNAQREHQEFMQTVEAVARENAQVFAALGPGGAAVFPADDAFTPLWRGLAQGRRQQTFGIDVDAEVYASSRHFSVGEAVYTHGKYGEFSFRLNVPGVHNVRNALAAAACALAAGAPVEAVVRGLESFTPVKGRLVAQRLQAGGSAFTLVDDSYNANPDSVRAAIDVLAAMPAPRWLVLGDMGEVGAQGAAFHREVGAYARERGIERLFALGDLARHAAGAFDEARAGGDAAHYAQRDALADALRSALASEPPASLLVKGSRFMKMEEFVGVVRDWAAQPGRQKGAHAA
jgi:UDP-N-acetylmuramoyl-tripeptide--D-alanyl-D-alanine ligase